MNSKQIKRQLCFSLTLFCLIWAVAVAPAFAQGTEFSYQGRLTTLGNPADGLFDMQFKLFDTAVVATGSQQGPTVTNPSVQVTNAIFTVQLDFGAGVFTGEPRFLEIGVRAAGSPDPYTILSPRQPLTSIPYAVRSTNAQTADTAMNATQLGGQPASGFIQNTTSQQAATNFNISGNGTIGGTLTTSGLRTEANATSPNVIGGFSGNTVTAGAVGAAIGGGGLTSFFNRVTDDFGTVGGGRNNRAGDNAGTTTDSQFAIVGGGVNNTASGTQSTVGGGGGNVASSSSSTVGGGFSNTASGFISTVGGGASNTASGDLSTVPGGQSNVAQGIHSFAAGRRAKANHAGAFVWADSTDADFASTAADQFLIRASGGVGITGNLTASGSISVTGLRTEPNATSANVVGGFSGNTMTAGVFGATIGGGGSTSFLNRVTDDFGTIGGGRDNQAGDNAGTTTDRLFATVGGGAGNTASGSSSTVGGGILNSASGNQSTVGGGAGNIASNSQSTVGGGTNNIANGPQSTVPGGSSNTAAGTFSFAAGRRAKANHTGAFVWADSNDLDFASTAADQFLIRASGGVGITGNLTVSGMFSTSGSISLVGLRTEANASSPNVVGGFSGNTVTASVVGATIGGGGAASFFNLVTDNFGTIAGGRNNQAGDNAGTTDDRGFATVSGGIANTASGSRSIVGGGTANDASGSESTVGGGFNNSASGNLSTIGGGRLNTASGSRSTVPGGEDNRAAGDFSFAAGRRAEANHAGAFVWADSTDFDFVSTADDQFLIRASGGVGIGTTSPLDTLHVAGNIRVGTGTTGCVRDADGTVIAGSCSSDIRFKKQITPFSNLIDKLTRLQPAHFYWRSDEFPSKHFGSRQSFGLIAQEVEEVLPELVAEDEQGFKAVNYSKLPLMLLQAVKELKAENDMLRQRLEQQEERLRRLEAAMGRASGKD